MRTRAKNRTYIQRVRGAVVVLVLVALGLTLGNAYYNKRDIDTALGPEGPAQLAFFQSAADRPDINAFYKKLSPAEKVAFARNIGRYSAPKLASLIVALLGDFDAEARAALTASLSQLARERAGDLAAQIGVGGSFQKVGVFTALRSLGSGGLKIAAEAMAKPETRANAKDFLVSTGKPALVWLLPMLGAADKDVRIAAIEALGRIGAAEAVPALLVFQKHAAPEENGPVILALAAIGDRRAEPLMMAIFGDKNAPISARQQAAFGLGRIASPTGAAALWGVHAKHDAALEQSVRDALIASGDAALKTGGPEDLFDIAKSVNTPLADQIVLHEYAKQPVEAARAMVGRRALAGKIVELATHLDVVSQGDIADALTEALSTTVEGKARLQQLAKDKNLEGFAKRRLALIRG